MARGVRLCRADARFAASGRPNACRSFRDAAAASPPSHGAARRRGAAARSQRGKDDLSQPDRRTRLAALRRRANRDRHRRAARYGVSESEGSTRRRASGDDAARASRRHRAAVSAPIWYRVRFAGVEVRLRIGHPPAAPLVEHVLGAVRARGRGKGGVTLRIESAARAGEVVLSRGRRRVYEGACDGALALALLELTVLALVEGSRRGLLLHAGA